MYTRNDMYAIADHFFGSDAMLPLKTFNDYMERYKPEPPQDWKQQLADHFHHFAFEDFNTDEQSIANWIEENVIGK